MLGWILSLILTLVFAGGSLLPGTVDGALTRELQARVGPGGTAEVRIQGDPLLQLPFGRVPVVEARLAHAALLGPRLEAARLRLEDVRLDPIKILAKQAVLVAPARATLEARLTAEDLQAYLEAQEAVGALSGFKGEVVVFGQRMGGTVSVHAPRVRFEDGRLVLGGEAELVESGARVPFEASAGLAVEGGTRILLDDPRLMVRGRPVPPVFMRPVLARLNPVLDLTRSSLPPGTWQLERLAVVPGALEGRLTGTITALPAAR